MTIQQLEALRAQLVRAQRLENACVRKLNSLLVAGLSDRAAYRHLVDRCAAARQRSIAAYEAWSAAVARLGEAAPYGREQAYDTDERRAADGTS